MMQTAPPHMRLQMVSEMNNSDHDLNKNIVNQIVAAFELEGDESDKQSIVQLAANIIATVTDNSDVALLQYNQDIVDEKRNRVFAINYREQSRTNY